jgi:hypothetical protein
VTTTHRSRLSLLRLVLIGTIAVPAFAASTGAVDVFGASGHEKDLVTAPPPVLFVVVGVAMVAWAIGRRHLKSIADLQGAEADA